MRTVTLALVMTVGLVLAGFLAVSVPGHVQAGNSGDANCDLEVTATDAALVLQYDAGLITDFLICADPDANVDQTVNSIDAQLILQFSAGLIAALPPP